ncbi:MAG: hypothetical protein K9H64_08175 [Bacteroidales bacterium]|nr:hypothetical protein [Bacteroidales bacterium]MCF8455807.1 hypothetical protein [Bacteroidales bacterium]
MEKKFSQMKLAFDVIKLQTILSTLFILLSLFIVVLQFQELRSLCVCISNYLAWSWIAFGIAILIGLIVQSLVLLENSSPTLCKLFLAIQSLAFYIGIVLAVLFGSFLLKVI